MEEFFLITAITIAGVAFAIGTASFALGLFEKKEKDHLLFGLMGLCLAVYFLLPPVGFILVDNPPYSYAIEIKRIFNL
jgi:hypothetical protein